MQGQPDIGKLLAEQEFQPGNLAPEIWQQSYYDALKWARSIAAPLREK